MILRPFIASEDADIVKDWITDPRTHQMWCAGRMEYPLTGGSLVSFLDELADRSGDKAFAATVDDGKTVGFFVFSLNPETNEVLLKFIVVDPHQRGKGTAQEMLRLAVRYSFENANADAVHLNVFSANLRARRCYEKAGFTVRNITPGAFSYEDESWDRVNMIIRKE